MFEIISRLPKNGVYYFCILVVGLYVVVRSVFVSRIAGDAFVIGKTKFNSSSEDRLVCLRR
jgi:hypothetical protein